MKKNTTVYSRSRIRLLPAVQTADIRALTRMSTTRTCTENTHGYASPRVCLFSISLNSHDSCGKPEGSVLYLNNSVQNLFRLFGVQTQIKQQFSSFVRGGHHRIASKTRDLTICCWLRFNVCLCWKCWRDLTFCHDYWLWPQVSAGQSMRGRRMDCRIMWDTSAGICWDGDKRNEGGSERKAKWR